MPILRGILAVVFLGALAGFGCTLLLTPRRPTPQELAAIAEARLHGHAWGAARILWRCRGERRVADVQETETARRRIELHAAQRAGPVYAARLAFLDAADEAEAALLARPLGEACLVAHNMLMTGLWRVEEAQRQHR